MKLIKHSTPSVKFAGEILFYFLKLFLLPPAKTNPYNSISIFGLVTQLTLGKTVLSHNT